MRFSNPIPSSRSHGGAGMSPTYYVRYRDVPYDVLAQKYPSEKACSRIVVRGYRTTYLLYLVDKGWCTRLFLRVLASCEFWKRSS